MSTENRKAAVVKTTKQPFIIHLRNKMRNKKDCTTREASEIYDIFIATLMDEILAGHKVVLTGFGNFTLKIHKGHKIRFTENSDNMNDYLTLKFTSSNTLCKTLRSDELLKKVLISQVTPDNFDKNEV